ncbi:MAG: CDF family Co(II)/Ni(II) efflux transporter DmeF [Comamonas sp.]|jgi:cation diffusion facilitator family transporter|uniref:CDF family Co(II)/Ni(II) efflux transporter DmeF n=1 Tax=Comamonas sp. TaxID=34028 RepID=UPI00283CE25E|nr:CDF family Co(II)/Ni(II) efflux transporter DmeF [Comamonas sp.]MDR3065251.1 CDF family Co(II)/Ni(II) efflux transporter DmeF [Comamonas sp.]
MTSSTAAPQPHTRQHSHRFDQGNPLAEKNAKLAMVLTLVMMVLEITAGYYFNSMALLADGWHMSSHALALGLSVSAYAAARKLANDGRFSFGTWKIEILAGYTSAICLLLVAALMAFESIHRLLSPAAIHYQQAIGVAVLGLLVNLACAWLLKDGHPHHHDHESHHDHHHGHDHAHGDLNLRSAYLHVIADAATSVMAIVALLGGMLLGLVWLDSVMGLIGSAMVAAWAFGLLRDSSRVLLDAEMDAPVVAEVREAIAQAPLPVNITDLHVWRVGKNQYACIIAVESAAIVTPDYIRGLLALHDELTHVSVEVNRIELA